MRLFLLIISFFFLQQTCFAQDAVVYDSSEVQVRALNAEKLNAYKADKDFQYERYTEPPKSLWDRFWDWLWQKIDQLLSTKEGSATFKTVLIILAVAILVFFILKLKINFSSPSVSTDGKKQKNQIGFSEN